MNPLVLGASRLFMVCMLALNAVVSLAQPDATTVSKPATDTVKSSFPGGIDAWRRYLERNLHYPKAAMQNNKSGMVRVETTIDKEGKVAAAKALNDPGDGLAEEAVRVVKESPAWVPAMQKGSPVSHTFVQKITFQLGTGPIGLALNPNRYNQTIVIKSRRLYKDQPIVNINTTEDTRGTEVLVANGQSYFISRDEAMQQLGVLVTNDGFVVPEDASVLYYDNNGVVTDNFQGLKFVGGIRNFRLTGLFKPGNKKFDESKLPIFILNGKEVPASEIENRQPFLFRAANLLRMQDEPAKVKLGEKGKNGVLFLSTRLPYPDNYLYLLDGQVSTNEAIAALPPGTVYSTSITMGKYSFEKYGEGGKYGAVSCTTRKPAERNMDSTVYSKATTAATFPGGEEGWKKYLATNLKYPALAIKNKTEGTVRVRLIINPEGKITGAYSLNDPGNGLGLEAQRLLKEGPQWIPADMNGKKVNYTLVVLVPFKLDPNSYF